MSESWRQTIAAACTGIQEAHEYRRRVFCAAHSAGLSLRDIAEAADVSFNTVSRIIGPVGRRRASLDSAARTEDQP